MTWDITNPLDTDSVRVGASVIRTLKQDIQAALQTEGIFPGSDVTNPVFHWKPPYGITGARPGTPTTGQLYVNTTLNVIERYNGASWDAIATLVPAGTVMSFFQAVAPLGWTQVVTQNDAVLRVVNGAGGGSGGADSVATPPTHLHSVTLGAQVVMTELNQGIAPTASGTINTGATVGFSPKYIDVMICSKN